MDRETVRIYDANAPDFAVDWEETQSPPDDLRAVVKRYFKPGPTADIGCGSGRDAAWLFDHGFDTIGIDASQGLLDEASRRHPQARFAFDALPKLASLTPGTFTNVLCETVIMHLDTSLIPEAVRRLASLLADNGVLYLTWRVTEGEDIRDQAGRLYSAFSPDLVLGELTDMEIELNERSVSASSGKIVHRIVARRRPRQTS